MSWPKTLAISLGLFAIIFLLSEYFEKIHLQAAENRRKLEAVFDERTNEAIKATWGPCGKFLQIVNPPLGLEVPPKVVLMGRVVKDDPSEYVLRAADYQIMLVGKDGRIFGEKYSASRKCCVSHLQ